LLLLQGNRKVGSSSVKPTISGTVGGYWHRVHWQRAARDLWWANTQWV